MSQGEVILALEAGDVLALRDAWAKVAPGSPQPRTNQEAEQAMHYARTACPLITFKAQAYSHRWLTERGLPSGLPDVLRPRAERMYPQAVTMIGVSITATNPALKPAARLVQRAICDAIEDLHASGVNLDTDPIVKRRMQEARFKEEYRLFGRRRR